MLKNRLLRFWLTSARWAGGSIALTESCDYAWISTESKITYEYPWNSWISMAYQWISMENLRVCVEDGVRNRGTEIWYIFVMVGSQDNLGEIPGRSGLPFSMISHEYVYLLNLLFVEQGSGSIWSWEAFQGSNYERAKQKEDLSDYSYIRRAWSMSTVENVERMARAKSSHFLELHVWQIAENNSKR